MHELKLAIINKKEIFLKLEKSEKNRVKKEILLIKALFNIENIHRHPIHKKLMSYFGQRLKKDKIIFTVVQLSIY